MLSNKIFVAVMAGLAGLLVIGPFAEAENPKYEKTVADFMQDYHTNGLYPLFTGVAAGVSWSAAVMREDYGIALYCQPPALAINTHQYYDILKDFTEKNPSILQSPYTSVPAVLIRALQDVFPCED